MNNIINTELSQLTETGMDYTPCYMPCFSHGSLFSGIGGFDLAAQWMGWNNIFQVEKDEWLRKLLKQNFPNALQYDDIRTFDGKKYEGTIDIISGGFPCQPFSVAGNRKGTNDDRYLWPEMLRIITDIKPKYIVGENVAGLLTMENGKTIERILSDLEIAGYKTEIYLIPACGVGAWHKRERIWITTYTCNGANGSEPGTNRKTDSLPKLDKPELRGGLLAGTDYELITNPDRLALQRRLENRENGRSNQGIRITSFDDHENWQDLPEPTISGGDNGVSDRVDRTKALGNAIVPQVAYEIFRAIEAASLHGM